MLSWMPIIYMPEAHKARILQVAASRRQDCYRGKAGADFTDLPGPASVIRLKEACGHFSAAEILRAAMEEEDISQAMDGWVLMQR